MNGVFTVSIIGCGSRGQNAYGKEMFAQKDKFKILSICDFNPVMLNMAKDKWGLSEKNCFLSEEEFFKEKRSDVLVIATQDRDHVRMCIKALELGYDVLLEKPISPLKEELTELLEAQRKYNKKIVVCHVLRYAPAYLKIKEIIDSGKIGKIVSVDWLEQVAYWHQAHSFVRGNWKSDIETSPMILAKCCHDLDLIQYFAGAKCKTVYSVGNTAFFNKENQPKGASEHCKDCQYINTCPYSAERVYVELRKEWNVGTSWPFDVVDSTRPITDESLRRAYENSQYGKCVFCADNNVVDNQMTTMEFENGVKVNLNMTGFTAYPGRKLTIHGTYGEIELDEWRDFLRVTLFGEQSPAFDIEKYETYSVKDLIRSAGRDSFGHGGGDQLLIRDFYNMLAGEKTIATKLEDSIESHLMALCAEESRRTNKIVYVHKGEE